QDERFSHISPSRERSPHPVHGFLPQARGRLGATRAMPSLREGAAATLTEDKRDGECRSVRGSSAAGGGRLFGAEALERPFAVLEPPAVLHRPVVHGL